MEHILKKEIWGKCAELPSMYQKAILEQDKLSFGEIGKIIKKAYPKHGLPAIQTEKRFFKATFSRKVSGYEHGEAIIEAEDEDQAKIIAKNYDDDEIEWKGDVDYNDCDDMELDSIEETDEKSEDEEITKN